MKISHKWCVRMDGTQFFYYDGLPAKNEDGNDKWSWVYHQQQRVVYQNLFAYDLALLFITSIVNKKVSSIPRFCHDLVKVLLNLINLLD